MTEELLRSVRDLLIADLARVLQKEVRDFDPPEDIEEVDPVFSGGKKERRLTWPAALRAAAKAHLADSKIIREVLP